MRSKDPRRPSRRLTRDDIAEIIRRLLRAEFQSRIAADFDVNQGRISEIKKRYLEDGEQLRLL